MGFAVNAAVPGLLSKARVFASAKFRAFCVCPANKTSTGLDRTASPAKMQQLTAPHATQRRQSARIASLLTRCNLTIRAGVQAASSIQEQIASLSTCAQQESTTTAIRTV